MHEQVQRGQRDRNRASGESVFAGQARLASTCCWPAASASRRFMAQMHDLRAGNVPYEIALQRRARRSHGAIANCCRATSRRRPQALSRQQRPFIDIEGLLVDQPLGTHVYVCGPAGMIDARTGHGARAGLARQPYALRAVRRAARRRGIRCAPGEVRASTCMSYPDQSLLEAIEAAGSRAFLICAAAGSAASAAPRCSSSMANSFTTTTFCPTRRRHRAGSSCRAFPGPDAKNWSSIFRERLDERCIQTGRDLPRRLTRFATTPDGDSPLSAAVSRRQIHVLGEYRAASSRATRVGGRVRHRLRRALCRGVSGARLVSEGRPAALPGAAAHDERAVGHASSSAWSRWRSRLSAEIHARPAGQPVGSGPIGPSG